MKKSIFLFLTLFLLIPALAPACPSYYPTDQAYLKIEFAPVFSLSNGSGQTTGTYFTVYNESFSIGPPSSGRMDTNTGIYTPPYTPSGLAFFYGDLTYFIKTQTGVYDDTIIPPMNQMVIHLEGSNTPAPTAQGQGGMFDIINDGLKWAGEQAVPPGMVLWTDSFRIGAYDIPIPSEPTILTNSRLQYHLLTNTWDYDPSVETLTTNWSNVQEWGGGFPSVHSSYDANGLDVWFESTDIGTWLYGTATESQGVRMVTFFNGEFPVSGGGGGGGESVPEPTTLLLYGLGFAGAGVYRRFRKKR